MLLDAEEREEERRQLLEAKRQQHLLKVKRQKVKYYQRQERLKKQTGSCNKHNQLHAMILQKAEMERNAQNEDYLEFQLEFQKESPWRNYSRNSS